VTAMLEVALLLVALAPCGALLRWTYNQAELRDDGDD
jgi:hypothetical protein